MQRWFSKPTTTKAPSPRVGPESAHKRRLVLIGLVVLLGLIGGLGWWVTAPAPAPVVESPQPTRTEPVVVVVEPPALPVPASAVENAAVPVPAPEPVLVDPFQAYQQIAGDNAGPAAGGTGRIDRPSLPPPPAPMPMPAFTPPVPRTQVALPPAAPAIPPRPERLQDWLSTAGWTLEAVATGTDPTALLSRQGESGLYRVGETLDGSVRILRIEDGRVVLARGSERATLEVVP